MTKMCLRQPEGAFVLAVSRHSLYGQLKTVSFCYAKIAAPTNTPGNLFWLALPISPRVYVTGSALMIIRCNEQTLYATLLG